MSEKLLQNMTQIIPLSEGTFTIGHDKIFQPFNDATDVLNSRPTGSLLVEVQPFAIVNDKDIILLDTGLGFNHPDGKALLVSNLAQHNIMPEDVTKIMMSHLHKDHAGGLMQNIFTQASIYVSRKEMDYADKIGFPSYYSEDLQWLKTANNIVWLDEESGFIDDYIRYEHSGAHAPHHIVFKIADEEGGIIFYGGDEAPQYKQMRMKYIAKYDFDGRKAMQLREQWAEEGAAAGWKFLFYHDVKTPIMVL